MPCRIDVTEVFDEASGREEVTAENTSRKVDDHEESPADKEQDRLQRAENVRGFMKELRDDGPQTDGPARAKLKGQPLNFIMRRINQSAQTEWSKQVTLVHRNDRTSDAGLWEVPPGRVSERGEQWPFMFV